MTPDLITKIQAPDLNASLAAELERVSEASEFIATWSDPIEHEPRVSRAELLEIVRRSEIGTRTRYHVSAT